MTTTLASINLGLMVGSLIPTAAPASLVQALQSAEINCGDKAPSGFRLTFYAERYGTGTDEPLLSSGLLDPQNRIILTATINGTPQVLMDGFITGQEYNPGPRGATVTVTGQDVSVKMDMFEISLEWPFMMDYVIAAAVLAKYLALGIIPVVIPTMTSIVPMDYAPQQNSTDRAYLQQLAGQNGCVFYVQPGPVTGMNTAYWGPPIRIGTPQSALTVNMGPFTNVESINFSYDAMSATLTYGVVEQWPSPVPLPVIISATTRLPALATEPALGNYAALASNPLSFLSDLLTLKVRGSLFQHQARNYLQAAVLAQLSTDTSVDNVVTVQGTVDTLRYGGIIQAPGLIAVRGAGTSYDGVYYVNKVTHKINTRMGQWDYKQDFVLSREGVGSTIQEVAS